MRPLIGVVVGTVAAWLCAAPADAASVKSVQTGTLTMSSTVQTATLGTAVNSTKAFIVCSSRTNSSAPTNRATCELSNTTVTVTTAVANASQVVRWHVVEFDGGVSVQRGLANVATGTATVNQAITSVTLGKTFHLLTERTAAADTATNADEQWTIRGQLTTATNLALTRNETGFTVTVAWQVIQMDDASVQRGLVDIAGGSASNTQAITSVATGSSFLVFSRRGATTAAGIEANYQVRGQITSATQLTFTRTGTTGATNISWEVVTMSDGTAVQRGTSSTAAVTDTTLNATLSPAIDTTTTIPWISASVTSGPTTDQDLDASSWSATFSTTTNLQLQRIFTNDAQGQVAWQVISFFKCNSGSIANVSYSAVSSQSGSTVVRWSAASPAIILRKPTTAFGTEAPVPGTVYSAGNTIGAATVVYNGAIVETSFTDSTVSNGTTYFYKVFVRGGPTSLTPCYSTGAGTDVTARPVLASTGVAWSYMLAGGASLRSPVAGGANTVFYASNANRIVGLSSTDGAQLWAPAATTGAVQGGLSWLPLSAGGAQVIGGDGGATVYAVNVATGTTFWTTALTGATAVQGAVSAQVRAFADAAFAAAFPGTFDVIIVGSRNASTTNNRFYALRSDTGAALWTFNSTGTFTVDGVIGQPWVDYSRNRVYVTTLAAGGTQPSLWVINGLTGALAGACPGTGCFNLGDIQSAPTLSGNNDRLWIGATNGNVFSLNLNTLAQNWTSPMALGASASVVGFVWEDFSTANRLYFSTADGNVWAVQDPYVSGAAVAPPNPASPVWKRAVAGASALLQYDFIYVGSSDGKIHQINITTGADVKQFTVGDGTRTVGDVSTDDGTQLYVGTTEGTIYEITLPLP